MKRVLFSLLFLVSVIPGFSQYYSTGEDPASLKWRQIKTGRYSVIYPEAFESRAQYLANLLDIISRNATQTLSSRVPRIPVLLHSESSTSNGLTVWAPRRIQLYPCTPQVTYAEEWLEQLILHEYRHAVQISKINQGFTRGLGYVFGEQAIGGILGLFVPSWFLEGDATVTETALTHAGRGRVALFESPLRSQLDEKGIYSYDKATLGSYRSFVPSSYDLGYFLVGQARVRYGERLWNEALDRVAKYPFMFVPFNSGIRKVTGKWKTGLYRETMKTLDSNWKARAAKNHETPCRTITRRNPKNYTVYNHPVFLDDSTILADRMCMDDIDRFVLINRRTGREKVLLTPGNHISGTLSTGGDYLVWNEAEPDKRWGNRDYAEIRIYNFKTGRMHELADDCRYFSPILSPDAGMVAAVHVTTRNDCSIDLLAVPGGELVRRYPIPDYSQAITPNWSPDGTRILFTLLAEKGEAIVEMDTASGRIRQLTDWSYNEYSGPTYLFGNYIGYTQDVAGNENVFAMDTLTRQVFQVTSARYAAFDPDFSPDRKWMIFSNITSDGWMVAEAAIDTSIWVKMTEMTAHSQELAQGLAAQEKTNIQDSARLRRLYRMNTSGPIDLTKDSIDGTLYPSRPYSKVLHLFNPHSWAPVSFDLNNLTLNPGVMVLSQNVLSTMAASAGYSYSLNEQTGKFYAGLSYRGWYPEVSLRFGIGNRAAYARYEGHSETFRFTWQETSLQAGIGIPFNFSHTKFIRSLTPFVGTSLIGISHNSSTPEQFTSGLIQSMDYSLSASQYLQWSLRDVLPRWGQALYLSYRDCPFGGNSLGSVFGTSFNLYFPGIFRHQGLMIYAGYQHREEEDIPVYSFPDVVSYPRGYTDASDRDLYSLAVNYKFPLAYPDFSAGSVLYLKRIKMNLFYDWANGNNPGQVNTYQSTGCELTFDFHLLRFIAPVEMGVRGLYFPGEGTYGFEFLYAISY